MLNWIKFDFSLRKLAGGSLPNLEINFDFMGRRNIDWKFEGFSFSDFGPLILSVGYHLLSLFGINV